MGSTRPSRSMLRVLAVSIAGIALLTLGVRFALDWIAIWNRIFPPPSSRLFCSCPMIERLVVVPPSPAAILIAYAFAAPSLIAIGVSLVAKRDVPTSRTVRTAGVLLIGSMVAFGCVLLALLTPQLVTGSTGVLVALVAFLAVPVVVLSAAGLLLSKELRGRLTRKPPVSAG